MIVIDSSALIAIALGEPEEAACRAVVKQAPGSAVSAATLMESLVVAQRRGVEAGLKRLLDIVRPEVVPLTEAGARDAARAYARWGKGADPARLNLADCFAYALAQEGRALLLYVGGDFAQTDVASAPSLADR